MPHNFRTEANDEDVLHKFGNETADGDKFGNWYQTAPTIDVIGTQNATTDTANLQSALTQAAGGRPTKVRLVCHSDHSGLFNINDTLVIGSGAWLDANVLGSVEVGPRIVWGGSVGGTMARCNGQRAFIGHVQLMGNGTAGTCLSFEGSSERMGYEDIAVERFTGVGVAIGNGIANLNGFRGNGVLYIRGLAGSTALEINALATEDIHLETVNIGQKVLGQGAHARLINLELGEATIDEAILDDADLLDYAVRINNGNLRFNNMATEVRQLLIMTNVGRQRSSHILAGDLRSGAPQTGQNFIQIGGTGPAFLLGPVNIARLPGSTNAPNVVVKTGAACIELDAQFTASGVETPGTIIPETGAHVIRGGRVHQFYEAVRLNNAVALEAYTSGGTALNIARLSSSNHTVVGALSDSSNDAYWDAGVGKHEFRAREGGADIVRGRLEKDSTMAANQTNLWVRRTNATAQFAVRQIKAAETPPAGSQVLYVDPT